MEYITLMKVIHLAQSVQKKTPKTVYNVKSLVS